MPEEVWCIILSLAVPAVQVEGQTCLYTEICGRSCVTGQGATYTWCQYACSRCQASGAQRKMWLLRPGWSERPLEVGSCGKAGRYLSISGYSAAQTCPAQFCLF